MVTNRAPHKEIEEDPGAGVRFEMARLAAAGEEGVEASEPEVGRDQVSYSYRTLELLREEDPERELWFLLGADMATGMARWKEPARGVELGRWGGVRRPRGALGSVRPVWDSRRSGRRRGGSVSPTGPT